MSDKRVQKNANAVCELISEKLAELRVAVVTIGVGAEKELIVYHRSPKIPVTAPGQGRYARYEGFKVTYTRIGAVIPCALEGASKARQNRARKTV